VPGQVAQFPLNEYEIMTLQGHGVSYFSAKQLTELSGVTMQVTYTIKGQPASPAGLTGAAVWQSFKWVEDVTHHVPFQYAYSQFALDRRTGQIVGWNGNMLGTAHPAAASGQSYVWPISAGKHSYRVFDQTAGRAFTARFAGAATTDKIATYRYVETVAGQRIGSQTIPGSLIGSAAASVTLPEFYSATVTYWVDPVTGDPLKISEHELLTLRDSSGVTRLVLLRGTLTTTPASVRTVSAPDRANLARFHLIGTVIPLAAGILGIVLLAAAAWLLAGRRPGTAAEDLVEQEPRPMQPSSR